MITNVERVRYSPNSRLRRSFWRIFSPATDYDGIWWTWMSEKMRATRLYRTRTDFPKTARPWPSKPALVHTRQVLFRAVSADNCCRFLFYE